MSKALLVALAIFSVCGPSISPKIFASTINATQDDPAVEAFKRQMQEEIRKAEAEVQRMKKMVMDKTRVPVTIDKVAFRNAITMLEVKKTLVNNFQDSPLLSNPRVRSTLLTVLQSDFITESDLANLQSVVEAERRK